MPSRVPSLDIRIDRTSPIPLYFQLASQLEDRIASGTLVKGEFLDNEVDLAEAWQVSRPTVRQAMQALVDKGLLVRRRGVGTQVVNDQVRRPAKLTSLYDDLAEQGRNPSTMLITHERIAADSDVAESLGLAPGSEVVYIERCRSAGLRRLAIMRNWLTVDAAGTITAHELRTTGLYELLRSRGVYPHSATQRIGASSATPTEAALLDLPVGAPLLTMRRVMQSMNAIRIEVGDHVYDASHYAIDMTVIDT
ncbi:MAG: hypothetical protein RLZZ623_3060 [Actinomycetota bacterium]|jgi:DNA-binding GntR family transcriptional regulator